MRKISGYRHQNPQKALNEKIEACNRLVIQSMQKTMNPKMFFTYLRQNHIENQVTQFRVNNTDGIIKIIFRSPIEAMKFYQERSFKDFLIIRKFNVYFDLSASESDVKKYFLRGVNQDKIRSVFESCKAYGVVRLNTLYGYNKMKDTCIVCYLRSEPLSTKEFNDLTNELQKISVTLDHFKDKQNLNYSKLNQSQIKQQEKDFHQKKVESNNQSPIVTLITIHNQKQHPIIRSNPQIKSQIQKIIKSKDGSIFIHRYKIPTLNPGIFRVLLIRDIYFDSEQMAYEKYKYVDQWLKHKKQNGILYHYSPNKTSTLVTYNPMQYVFKAKNGKLLICSRTEDKKKLIKIAEMSYDQIDEFLLEEERIQISLYEATQIDNYGDLMEQINHELKIGRFQPFQEDNYVDDYDNDYDPMNQVGDLDDDW